MKIFTNQIMQKFSIVQYSRSLIMLSLMLPLSWGPALSAIATETNTAQASLEFESSPTPNQTTLVQNWVNHETTYQQTGVEYKEAHCATERKHRYGIPASFYGPTVLVSSNAVTPYRSGQPRTKAFFVSSKTPPASGLRVAIQNQTIGGETIPFTDREYNEKSRRSEKFFVSPEQEHKSKYLAVAKGNNRMTYQIKRGDQVIESGEFTVSIDIDDRNITKTITHPRQVIEIPCPDKDDKDDHDRKHKHHH